MGNKLDKLVILQQTTFFSIIRSEYPLLLLWLNTEICCCQFVLV